MVILPPITHEGRHGSSKEKQDIGEKGLRSDEWNGVMQHNETNLGKFLAPIISKHLSKSRQESEILGETASNKAFVLV